MQPVGLSSWAPDRHRGLGAAHNTLSLIMWSRLSQLLTVPPSNLASPRQALLLTFTREQTFIKIHVLQNKR